MSRTTDLVTLSQDLLVAIKRGDESGAYVRELVELDDTKLATLTGDRQAATAFWINLYNAFVQQHLEDDPSLYEHRRQFFGEQRIEIAGTKLSLDDIEHGLLRSSKWKYGLGYVPRPFPSVFERTHRLPDVDPRIHFALNCGAESCPPIAAYSTDALDSELDTSTRSFLRQSSTHSRSANKLWITRLFLYYRGDFSGRQGIYTFLERHDVIDPNDRPRIRYDTYDWTLHKGMYRKRP